MRNDQILYGRAVIETLADTYRQLFVSPGLGGKEKYLDIVERGNEPSSRDLSHFITSTGDSLTYEETPAGVVTVITLARREDFVTFLRIMANRSEEVVIPDTQGASIIDGVINWRKIERHMEGFSDSDYKEEFRRFTSDRSNFKDALIVLSVGPYSAIPAEKIGISDDEWITLSQKIRKYHECTHFICRRLYPDKKDAIWDELVADAVGIAAAFGKIDIGMEKKFLGIDGNSYIGGRLENYTDVDTALIYKVCDLLELFLQIASRDVSQTPYELAIKLEDKKEELWDKR